MPLLERLKFLCISSSNLDEFFEIRVAGLKQLLELGSTQIGAGRAGDRRAAGGDPSSAPRSLVRDQYACLNEVLLPALAQRRHRGACEPRTGTRRPAPGSERHFQAEVEPVLSPLGLDPARPFPRIQNKSLNFIVRLSGKDAFGRDSELAIVQAPRSLPRIVALPDGGGQRRFVRAVDASSRAFVAHLFEGMQVLGCYQFRLTRNSDLFVDDEEVDDLRRALEGELAQRRYGAAVRLETAAELPAGHDRFPAAAVRADATCDCYQVPGPVNLNRFSAIYDLAQRPDLKYPPFTPGLPRAPGRRHRPVRGDPPARRAAAPPVSAASAR